MNPLHPFIHISLCDNDFADHLQKAVELVFADLGTTQPEDVFQKCVVDLTVALNQLRHYAFHREPTNPREYLEASISVLYSDRAPDIDHDGGSVAVDTNRNYIWRY